MHLILGAGCAGLSLALAMVDEGIDEQIVLVDRRTRYANDRTWCFWSVDDLTTPDDVVSHQWERWQMIGRDGRAVVRTSARHPYRQVRADDFYANARARLAEASNVQLRLGERVSAVDLRPDGQIEVQLPSGTLFASHVYDAMGGGGPLLAERPAGSIELRQTFLGLEVETAEPCFDPTLATLMDFRVNGPADPPRDDGGLHFMYVLPTTPTRALVEHTTLGPRGVPPAKRRAAIADHLSRHLGASDFAVLREERGTLPMSSHTFPVRNSRGVLAVGAAAGAVRPSSGYAFVRIQRHVRALAESIALGQVPPSHLGHRRHVVLDQLFLRSLAAAPGAFDRPLLTLAQHTSGDAFARFMSDASSPRDEAQIVASVARPGFVGRMAASSLLRPIDRTRRLPEVRRLNSDDSSDVNGMEPVADDDGTVI